MKRNSQGNGISQAAKPLGVAPARKSLAFTLIELLAVIGVIALLAALLVPLTALAVGKMKLAKARAELVNLDTIIKSYKEFKDLGTYPPDNTNNPAFSQLFYELSGTIYTTNVVDEQCNFTTVSGAGGPFSTVTRKQLRDTFGLGVEGIINSTQDRSETPVFTHNFSPTQYSTNYGITLLICPVHKPNGDENPWSYNSSGVFTNLNNPDGFDLWVDLVIRGKTNRICNWSTKPIIL